ncbi:hypothetical protein H4582DRAFT_2053391 [Lactarius indigo]|nr:hypothetical protein H4582DRAFT_2053391 [Lactarius indigo]
MDDDFVDDVFSQNGLSPSHTNFHFDYKDEDKADDFMGTQRAPRPPLRSRPPIDFGAGLPAFGAATCPLSHMSDAMLHSGLGHLAVHTFPHKISSLPKPSINFIASLSVNELCYNPHYLKLHEDFDRVCRALAMKTVSQGFTETSANAFIPDSCKDAAAHPLRTKDSCTSSLGPHTEGSCASSLGPHAEGSRASSLGPSDSASQQMRFDPTYNRAIKTLLETVEPLPSRPQFLPKEVLWYYEDCATDKSYGDIITKNNKYQPKMNLAIHCPDGLKVSAQEFANIQHSTTIIVQKLTNLISSDSCMAVRIDDPKSQTKSFVKHLFKAEYDQAILELEAEQRLLRLCYAHWKADTMIGQVFVRQNKVDAKAASNRARTTSSRLSDDTSEPPPAPVPQVWDIAPVNVAKCAFELSPGPKSPSALQAQKRSKDGVSLSGQKTTGPSVPSNCKYSIQRSFNTNSYLHTEPHRAHKLVPTFLSCTEVIHTELMSTKLHPVFVDPSADNLIVVLTSDFPSMTNALSLIHSMNAQMLFKQGKPSEKVTMLLERVQFTNPGQYVSKLGS